MRTIPTRSGLALPVLGLGTWRMGEDPSVRAREVAAIRAALDAGVTLIDTAEMYGEGGAEEVVGEALSARRDEALVVSKVYPWNATRDGTALAIDRSLARLRTDRIDLYLLHWRGRVPLDETLEALHRQRDAGKILHFGVSNFDVDDCDELESLPFGGESSVNQFFYNPEHRGAEWVLVDACVARGIGVMAYTPLGSGGLARSELLDRIARPIGASAAQVALAWAIRRPGVSAVVKTSRPERVGEIARAAEIELGEEALSAIDAAHPPPGGPVPLEVI